MSKIDYRGRAITPDQYHFYEQCPVCGFYVWHKQSVAGVCPLCVFKGEVFVVDISFGCSTQDQNDYAVRLAKTFSSYSVFDNRHVVRITSFSEFFDNADLIKKLLHMVFDLKSFQISINGTIVGSPAYSVLLWEIEKYHKQAGSK